jgi:hypothetical protein
MNILYFYVYNTYMSSSVLDTIKKSVYDFFPKTLSIWSVIFYFFFFYFITYTIATIVLYSKSSSPDILIGDESGNDVDGL